MKTYIITLLVFKKFKTIFRQDQDKTKTLGLKTKTKTSGLKTKTKTSGLKTQTKTSKKGLETVSRQNRSRDLTSLVISYIISAVVMLTKSWLLL